MEKFFASIISFICSITFAASSFAVVLNPVDREIHYSREASENKWTVMNDGQWHPMLGYIEYHGIDMALVLQFDLSAYNGESFGNAQVTFYITSVFQMAETRIAARYYEADRLITSAPIGDPENSQDAQDNIYAGDVLLDPIWAISTPDIAPSEEREFDDPICVTYNITDLVNNRTHDFVNINLRFAGSADDGWDGNVFGPTDGSSNYHFARMSAVEAFAEYRPTLELEQGPLGSISGTVTTSVTGADTPVVGASVTLVEKGRSTTTDADGKFAFSNVLEGAWSLRIEKQGFATLALEGVNVVENQDTDTGGLQMELETTNPWDINGDGKKGLAEAIDSLQTAAGLR